MSYSDLLGHRDMAFDPVKNAGYMAALDRLVTPETVVLDLGCGLASHGLYAALRGAKHVYLVDPEVAVEVAREVARHNGLSDRVTAIRGRIEEIDLPEKVDLIISVFTGNMLYSEDLLPSLYLARDRWLKPGGHLVPDCCELRVAPISAPKVWQREVGDWSLPKHGLDYRALRRYAANALVGCRDADDGLTLLASPMSIETADFTTATGTDLDTAYRFEITRSGDCHGLLAWIRFRTGDRWLETGPQATMHWTPQLLPIDPPFAVAAGDPLEGRLHRKTWGEWTWSLRLRNESRRQSTFLSQPLSARRLAGAAPGATLPLNRDGMIAYRILAGFAAGESNEAIARSLLASDARRYATGLEAALQEVKEWAISFRGGTSVEAS
ncbi:MAG: methyltransferase domain-containing protein [Casimicrobiaceae bacterium]